MKALHNNAKSNLTSLYMKKNNILFILKIALQIRVFDLDHDDPLMLSSIIGEAVVGCWSMEGIFRNKGYGKYGVAYKCCIV